MRLTNQLWKLIPMKEHEEDWQKQLDTVVLEIAGLNEILIFSPSCNSLKGSWILLKEQITQYNVGLL